MSPKTPSNPNKTHPHLTGSCLCGQVAILIPGPLANPLNCDCTMCRKAHAATFRTRATVDASCFHWLKGTSLVKRYESSRGEYRTFCSNCGSNLVTEFDHSADVIGLPLGILEEDPGVRPECHVFVSSKAPWHEISDELTQWETLPARYASREA